MPGQRITKRLVDALSSSGAEQFIWDDTLSGFGLRLSAKGHKTYILRYRMPGLGRRGPSKRLTLGDHGILTPDEARILAKRELGHIAHGSDPAVARATKRAAPTVSELGKLYLADIGVRRKEGTAKEYARLWSKEVLPHLASKRVEDVTLADIRRLHGSLHKTPYLANRVVAMLGGFFTFAEREGARRGSDNPTRGVEFFPETPRERFLTVEEFGRLGESLARAEREGLPPAPEHKRKPGEESKQKHRPKSADTPIPASPLAVSAIRLLALTGCRENEILSLRWDAVDLERGYIRLKDSKTGKSVRPLAKTAAEILASIPETEGNPYVLPGRKPGSHLKEIKRLWYAVRHAATLPDLRLHDLRHSFASVPAASGESMLVLKSLLGHRRVSTTERYAHLGDDPVKRAADQAAESIGGWLGSARKPQSTNEVPAAPSSDGNKGVLSEASVT